MVITDPGIKVDHGYKPYDDGISQGVFIKVLILSPNPSYSNYEANLYVLVDTDHCVVTP